MNSDNEVHIVWWCDSTDASSDHILGCFKRLEAARRYAEDVARDSSGTFKQVHDNEWVRNHTITIQTHYLND